MSCGTCDAQGHCTGTGYVGTPSLTCVAGQQFNVDGCKENKCDSGAHNCDVNADCAATDDGAFTCSCKDGFSGDGLTCVAENCVPNPCQNGGTCSPTTDSFECSCVGAYGGDMCDTPKCSAPDETAGYIIESCDGIIVSDDCTMSCGACDANGCVPGVGYVGTPELTCAAAGEQFQITGCSVDKCASGDHTCHADADCAPTNDGGYTCTCKAGFTGSGETCESENCFPNPCNNGGTCTPTTDSYFCTCVNGFGGQHCDELTCTAPAQTPGYVVGECSGTVIASECAVTCGCTGGCGTNEGYVGTPSLTCETSGDAFSVDGCSVDKCATGDHSCDVNAICTPTQDGEPTCACKEGYTGSGETCVYEKCSPNPCGNGGTCAPQGDSYICTCPAEYAGADCMQAKCTAPAAKTGYTVGSCEGLVISDDCDVECDHAGGFMGFAMKMCNTPGDPFHLEGCF